MTSHALQLMTAAWRGRQAVRRAARESYITAFAEITGNTGRACSRQAYADVRPLRAVWRCFTLFRRPGQEPVFLAAALLAHGRKAELILGREAVPTGPDAGYHMWITVDGQTASTGLPVDELFTPIASLPAASPDGARVRR